MYPRHSGAIAVRPFSNFRNDRFLKFIPAAENNSDGKVIVLQ